MVEGSPCPDAVWTGTVRAVATPGGQVFEAQTNVNGRFSFEVPSGTYDLTPVVAGPQTAPTTSMTVTPGQVRTSRSGWTAASAEEPLHDASR